MDRRRAIRNAALSVVALMSGSAILAALLGLSLGPYNWAYLFLLSVALSTSVIGFEFTGRAACALLYFNTIEQEILARLLNKTKSHYWDEPIVYTINIITFAAISMIQFGDERDDDTPAPYWALGVSCLYLVALPVYIFMPRDVLLEWLLTNVALYLSTFVVISAGTARLIQLPLPPWHEGHGGRGHTLTRIQVPSPSGLFQRLASAKRVL